MNHFKNVSHKVLSDCSQKEKGIITQAMSLNECEVLNGCKWKPVYVYDQFSLDRVYRVMPGPITKNELRVQLVDALMIADDDMVFDNIIEALFERGLAK